MTICEEHVDLAQRHAAEVGVGERCDFRLMQHATGDQLVRSWHTRFAGLKAEDAGRRGQEICNGGVVVRNASRTDVAQAFFT